MDAIIQCIAPNFRKFHIGFSNVAVEADTATVVELGS